MHNALRRRPARGGCAVDQSKEFPMFKKIGLAALVAATALTALPAAAEARSYYGYGYSQNYYDSPYDYGSGYSGYGDGYRYRPGDYYYGRNYGSYYGRGSYGRNYYGRNYYRNRCHRDGTTGAILGAVAGGLLGREIDRGGGRHYYRRGNGTTGLIVGGAAGALIGREIARDC
jgi:hypothetical protein